MQTTALYTRIAPTPSGYLHPGNGLSFLLTWMIARRAGGRILLRIDDLDRARYRPEYVEDIFETLDWLGIDYDEGPRDRTDFEQNWSQHQRLDLYAAALTQLRNQGQVFACACSRKQIRQRSADGTYPGTCASVGRSLDDESLAWRVYLPERVAPVPWPQWRTVNPPDDVRPLEAFVVKQKNGFPAYQLASLVDDTHFEINFIVRGQDLWESTRAQQYLAQLLGQTHFQRTIFWHHPLLLDEAGRKLSKSKGAGSLRAWRKAGRSPQKLIERAAGLLDS